MPNRILKESICTSENLDTLTAFQETMFYRLLVNCDDYGRFDGRTKILKSRLFPLKDDVRDKQIEDALHALTSAELVTLYYVDGKPFVQMKTWTKHQPKARSDKSKYPDIPADAEQVRADAEQMPNTCHTDAEQVRADDSSIRNSLFDNRNTIHDNRESNAKGELRSPTRARARFTPPTLDDVRKYCADSGYKIDAERFVAYYESNGWKVGKNPMQDWQAAVRTWVRNGYESGGKTSPQKKDYSDELPW